jgi:FKBP-type peptidyl-prolyl cis-trans isomerase
MNSETKNKWIAMIAAIVVVAFFFGGIIFYSFNNKVETALSGEAASTTAQVNLVPDSAGTAAALNSVNSQVTTTNSLTTTMNSITTADGLVIQDEVIGTGAEAQAGQTINVNYVGTLENGTKFDSSYDRGQPFQFTLGAGQVIRGWDEGFAGMKVGGKRKLVIPAALGYGDQAVGGVIPANSTLLFEVELVSVK